MDSDQNCSSLCSETQRVNCSKAQNCLLKILKIISTVPPPHNNNTPPSQKLNGFAVDLNIGFNLPAVDEKSPVAAECGGVDFGKCSDDEGEEKSCKSVEILQVAVSERSESKGEVKEEQGFMGLLIEAATLIFGEFKDEIPKSEIQTRTFKFDDTINKLKMDEQHYHEDVSATKKQQLKRRNNEEVIEDKSSYPLVRSKRGRIQVLPNKYRDSILEPLTPLSRIRSTFIPNRRRSK